MFNLSSLKLSHFLISMGILLALAHLLGYLAKRIGIPRVIGEVSAGLVLGPTLLRFFSPKPLHGCSMVFRNKTECLVLCINWLITHVLFRVKVSYKI